MNRPVTLAGYALIAVAMVVVQVIALRTGRLPTFRQAVGAVLAYRSWRLLVLAGWLWLGWHVFVRSDPGN